MTSHEADRIQHFGLGIPDDPTEEEAKRVLFGLHIGARYNWPKGDWVDCFRWKDGHRSRFHAERPTYTPCS